MHKNFGPIRISKFRSRSKKFFEYIFNVFRKFQSGIDINPIIFPSRNAASFWNSIENIGQWIVSNNWKPLMTGLQGIAKIPNSKPVDWWGLTSRILSWQLLGEFSERTFVGYCFIGSFSWLSGVFRDWAESLFLSMPLISSHFGRIKKLHSWHDLPNGTRSHKFKIVWRGEILGQIFQMCGEN